MALGLCGVRNHASSVSASNGWCGGAGARVLALTCGDEAAFTCWAMATMGGTAGLYDQCELAGAHGEVVGESER